MVADDERKITRQLPVALPVQQIHQTVIILGYENRHPGTVAAQANAPVHAKFVSDRTKGTIEIV
jgi:hypothetical protein